MPFASLRDQLNGGSSTIGCEEEGSDRKARKQHAKQKLTTTWQRDRISSLETMASAAHEHVCGFIAILPINFIAEM